jgi:hypothetical protein
MLLLDPPPCAGENTFLALLRPPFSSSIALLLFAHVLRATLLSCFGLVRCGFSTQTGGVKGGFRLDYQASMKNGGDHKSMPLPAL